MYLPFSLLALLTAAMSSADKPGTPPVDKGKWKISFEFRTRYEAREGTGAGKEPEVDAILVRSRLALSYTPVSWLKLSGMVQDSRAPLFGANAPASIRDTADLQEGYVELFPDRKRGFGLAAGRAMLNYGDGRLIGTPQWGNVARTYDHARVYYRWPNARLELLFVSPVKVRPDEFNRPVLGDRAWGAYNSFPKLFREMLLEAYVLRREQNRPGGFTGGSRALGTDRLTVDTFGFRLAGPLAAGTNIAVEGALQSGKVGPAQHRGAAWVSSISRAWTVGGKPLEVSVEYKFASGNDNPRDSARSRTFDQLYPANHDRFGHQDLFGWRNIHNLRTLATAGLLKNLSVNMMYSGFWLASVHDALYNGAGKPIAISVGGTAGRHVGEELDLFGVYRFKHTMVGAGYGYLFKGQFMRNAIPGVNPSYVYCFQTVSF